MELCKCILAAQRDHGNREIRANARMKYLVHTLGIDAFKTLVESYFGKELEPWRPMVDFKYSDWLGWHEQVIGAMRVIGSVSVLSYASYFSWAFHEPYFAPSHLCLLISFHLSLSFRPSSHFVPFVSLCTPATSITGRRQPFCGGERGARPHQGPRGRESEVVLQGGGRRIRPRHGAHPLPVRDHQKRAPCDEARDRAGHAGPWGAGRGRN